MGFKHTKERGILGTTPGSYNGDGPCRDHPTPVEVYHATIVYSRVTGNEDPDRDPLSFSLLRGGAGSHNVVWEHLPESAR